MSMEASRKPLARPIPVEDIVRRGARPCRGRPISLGSSMPTGIDGTAAVTGQSSNVRATSAAVWRYIALAQAVGFGVIVTVIWLDKLFDLPHRLFGAPISPVRVGEALLEMLGVTLLGVVVLVFTTRRTQRAAYLESYITLCAWCRRVRRNGQWLSVEAYFAQHDAETSHGICPGCETKALGLDDPQVTPPGQR